MENIVTQNKSDGQQGISLGISPPSTPGTSDKDSCCVFPWLSSRLVGRLSAHPCRSSSAPGSNFTLTLQKFTLQAISPAHWQNYCPFYATVRMWKVKLTREYIPCPCLEDATIRWSTCVCTRMAVCWYNSPKTHAWMRKKSASKFHFTFHDVWGSINIMMIGFCTRQSYTNHYPFGVHLVLFSTLSNPYLPLLNHWKINIFKQKKWI